MYVVRTVSTSENQKFRDLISSSKLSDHQYGLYQLNKVRTNEISCLIAGLILACLRCSMVTDSSAASVWTSEGSLGLPLEKIQVDDVKTTMFERRFNPYDFNGG